MAIWTAHKTVGMLVLACVAQTGTNQEATTPTPPAETVSLCQMTKHWESYDRKIVRLEANYSTGNETSEVYDPACATHEQTAWVKLLPYSAPSPVPAELRARLNELLIRKGRARITAIGEFEGPKQVNVPSSLSPEAADAMRETNSRYGHMGGWKFQFVFSKVEKVVSDT